MVLRMAFKHLNLQTFNRFTIIQDVYPDQNVMLNKHT